MIKHSSITLMLLLVATSVLADSSFRDRMRDLNLESELLQNFLLNSNKVVEVDSKNYPELDRIVSALSKKANIKKPMTFVITRKHPVFFAKVNAGAVGDKEKSAIFVGSWVLDKITTEELEGIVAHEITHIAKDHTTPLFTRALAARAAVFGLAGFVDYLVKAKTKNNYAALLAAASTFIIGEIITSLLKAKYSRDCEREADFGAIDLTDHAGLIGGLTKLDEVCDRYLPYSSVEQKEWLNRIFADHPLTENRLEYIKKYRATKADEEQKALVSTVA